MTESFFGGFSEAALKGRRRRGSAGGVAVDLDRTDTGLTIYCSVSIDLFNSFFYF